jgi:hypothetical protein
MAEDQQDAQQPEKPKIIVDDDWKAQAQADKERLEQEARAKKEAAKQQPADEDGAAGGQPRRLPPASFSVLVSSLATQAMMALGGYEDPRTKKRMVDLDLAKHHIDTLAVLEEKTKGNLSEDEKKMLDSGIYETRMQFVQMVQRLGPPGGGAG